MVANFRDNMLAMVHIQEEVTDPLDIAYLQLMEVQFNLNDSRKRQALLQSFYQDKSTYQSIFRGDTQKPYLFKARVALELQLHYLVLNAPDLDIS